MGGLRNVQRVPRGSSSQRAATLPKLSTIRTKSSVSSQQPATAVVTAKALVFDQPLLSRPSETEAFARV
eukprot:1909067-Rhodomonas_salina.3